MNKNLLLAVVVTLTAVVANAWPQPYYQYTRAQPAGYYTAGVQQRAVNALAYTGNNPRPMAVAQPATVRTAKTCNTPGCVRNVYVRAKHKTVNGVRVYVPAHVETRVGTYR